MIYNLRAKISQLLLINNMNHIQNNQIPNNFPSEPKGPNSDDFDFNQPNFLGVRTGATTKEGIGLIITTEGSNWINPLSRSIALALSYELDSNLKLENILEVVDLVVKDHRAESLTLTPTLEELVPQWVVDLANHTVEALHREAAVISIAKEESGKIEMVPILLVSADHSATDILTSDPSFVLSVLERSEFTITLSIQALLESEVDYTYLSNEEMEFISILRRFFKANHLSAWDKVTLPSQLRDRLKELFLKISTVVFRFTPLTESKAFNEFIIKALMAHAQKGVPAITSLKTESGQNFDNPIKDTIFRPKPEFYTGNPEIETIYYRVVKCFNALQNKKLFIDNEAGDSIVIKEELTSIEEQLTGIVGKRNNNYLLLRDHLNAPFMLLEAVKHILAALYAIRQGIPDSPIELDVLEEEDVKAGLTPLTEMSATQIQDIMGGEMIFKIARYLGIEEDY